MISTKISGCGFLVVRQRFWLSLAIVSLLASACAAVSDKIRVGADVRAAVTERVQLRWDAVLGKDFAAAYGYLSPATRSALSLDDYRRKAGMVEWTSAKIKSVECPEVDVCNVQLEARYAYTLRRGGGVQNEQMLTELWRYTAGGWWYVPSEAM